MSFVTHLPGLRFPRQGMVTRWTRRTVSAPEALTFCSQLQVTNDCRSTATLRGEAAPWNPRLCFSPVPPLPSPHPPPPIPQLSLKRHFNVAFFLSCQSQSTCPFLHCFGSQGEGAIYLRKEKKHFGTIVLSGESSLRKNVDVGRSG